MKRAYLILISLLSLAVLSCTKEFEGDREETELPQTFAVVDSVRRDSSNFLTTTVTAYWWGNSAKGFINGYEYSIDGMQTWKFTKKQSGSFLLNLPAGIKEGKLPVYIRAIDNLGRKDPTPAQLIFPVRNTAPRTSTDPGNAVPSKSFPVIRFSWISSDIDGYGDIDHYDLALNDTAAALFSVPGTLKDLALNDTSLSVSIRIEADRDNNGLFLNTCKVFAGSRTIALPGSLTGIKYDTVNTIYVRAVDRTTNKSAWTAANLSIRKPVSDVLIVNCLYLRSALIQNFYQNTLAKPLVNIPLTESLRGVNTLSGSSELYTDALAQQRTFNLFKKIIWLTDDANTLATIQLTTADFFANGGSMFIFSEFSDDFPVFSQVLSFTPVQALVDPNSVPGFENGRFRMDNSSVATPVKAGWPTLKFSGSITPARPFVTNTSSSGIFSYESLVSATVRVQTSSGSPVWTGPSTMMSKRVRISGNRADLILSSLPLQLMDGNGNIDSMFKKVFKDELNF